MPYSLLLLALLSLLSETRSSSYSLSLFCFRLSAISSLLLDDLTDLSRRNGGSLSSRIHLF
jgi:hypothetical protein